MSEGAEREREREKARAVEREGGKGDDGMVSCWMMMSFPLALTWMPCLDAVHTVNGSPARAALTPRPHTAVTPSQLTSRVKSSPIQPNPTPSPAQPPGPFLSLSPSLSLSRALLAPSYFFLLLLLFPLWLPPPPPRFMPSSLVSSTSAWSDFVVASRSACLLVFGMAYFRAEGAFRCVS